MKSKTRKDNHSMEILSPITSEILSTDDDFELETEYETEVESFVPINCQSQERISHESNGESSKDSDLIYDLHCSKYMEFTDQNPTTYHAVQHFSEILKLKNFKYVPETGPFDCLNEGGLFFTKRGGQAMVGFIVGGKWVPKNGVAGIGCHVDALTIKLKPISVKDTVHGYDLLGVAPYSGSLNHLWLDRDLGIAGSVLIRHKSSKKLENKLISSGNHAICRIPSLAPHFGSASSIPYNKETQMVPVMGFGGQVTPATDDEKSSPLFGRHSLSLLRYIAKLAKCAVSEILLVDLDLYDVQPAARGGLLNEFMFAPRIDDRLCSYSAIQGLVEHSKTIDLGDYDGFLIVLLANNEEIGSATRTGAKGKMLNSVIERVLGAMNYNYLDLPLVFANSVFLSADVTHALNPNFTEAYLQEHFPVPNKGLVVKLDANGHVMTDLKGLVLLNRIAQRNDLTLQQFHIRNDKPSGGTIGPMLAVDTGSRVIDVGLAQLSMHSIRAAAGYKEPGIGVLTFESFFKCWRTVLNEMDYD